MELRLGCTVLNCSDTGCGAATDIRMTTRKPRKAKEDPGHAIRATLKDMDFWVLSAYALTPLLLGTLGGIELIQLCIVI
jgi:hypothetical protein